MAVMAGEDLLELKDFPLLDLRVVGALGNRHGSKLTSVGNGRGSGGRGVVDGGEDPRPERERCRLRHGAGRVMSRRGADFDVFDVLGR